MKTYNFREFPIKVYGVPFFEETKQMMRLPEYIIDKYPYFEHIGRRCPGVRVCFRTNSKNFIVKVSLKTLSVDAGMSLYGCQSALVLVGEKNNRKYLGLVGPSDYSTMVCEKTFGKSDAMEDVIIWLPRNEIIENIEILIEDESTISEPTPYKYSKPVLFLGSSITEGGCSCNVTNAYNAILSERLDFDYYNFGFSGLCRGQIEIAEYIGTLDISAFVFDYDHNAPNVEHLQKTHEPFYKAIRKAHPNIPILMMTKPKEAYTAEDIARREVVKTTYLKAVQDGDTAVYFIDGEIFFGDRDRHLCTIDTIHPNDLGFYRMANVIEPVMKEMLLQSL